MFCGLCAWCIENKKKSEKKSGNRSKTDGVVVSEGGWMRIGSDGQTERLVNCKGLGGGLALNFNSSQTFHPLCTTNKSNKRNCSNFYSLGNKTKKFKKQSMDFLLILDSRSSYC